MDDLIAFLRDRIAEDEAVALAIRDDRYGDNDGVGWKCWAIDAPDDGPWPRLPALGVDLAHSYADNVITPQRGEHIARWDPARVLAEVDAKRKLIELYLMTYETSTLDSDAWTVMKDAMRTLTQPYADHPDYLPEWRS